MSQRIKSIFLLIFSITIILHHCKKETDLPDYSAQKSDIIGQWVVDEEAMKSEAGFSPTKRATIALLKGTRVEITNNQLTASLSLFGETKEFSGSYIVETIAGNTIKMRATSGMQKGQLWDVVFITRDQLRFSGLSSQEVQDGDEETKLIMKRVAQQ